ncbi:protein artemis-like [Planococcus citri]|uniref:protein artemis-like n=1 Tax=Planococcus citri TaxID=170843 RepID=UPI0031FA1FCA
MPSKKFRIVHRIPNSNILVDYWKSLTQDKYYRFMTYLRIGADDSIKDICESTYTIYTSLFNKWYLITYYQVSEHRIVELRENETITVLDDQSKPAFSVTAFDANYYTGSLMFLFQGSFGNVLYTGFFRPSSFDSIFEAPILKAVVDKGELDVAFIDNTYAAEHCEFPSRSEIMDQIVTCLRQHPKHKIAISGKRLGKEEILLDIAKALDEKIHVSEEKFIILSRLNLQSHFTTDKKKSRIYACDYIINPKECMKMQAEEGPYIIILLTAFYHCNRMSSNEEFSVPGLYIFPYSGHCSHSELVRFISFLKPRDVQPIIKFMTDEHSIIPQSIYKLCYKPLALTDSACTCKSIDSQKFYTCDAGNSQNFCSCKSQASVPGTSSSSPTDMITVYDSAQKQEMIDNAINELKSFNDVDDFLESVSDLSSVSNFGQDVSESIMSVSTIEIAGNLHESLFHNLMSNSGDSSDAIFYTSTTTGESSSQQSNVIPPTNTSSPVLPADTQNVDRVEQTNETLVPETRLSFSVSKSTSPLQNAKAFYKCFDNVISTSTTVLTNDLTKTSKKICNLSSQDEVHSTNTYVENDIAENVISSTNNDSFPDITSPPVQEPVEKQGTSISVTVGDVDIDIRSDLDLQDMTDKDEPSVAPITSNEVHVEKQPEVIKTYEEKSVQTELTLESLLQLEKSSVPQKSPSEAEPSVAQNQAMPDATEDVTRLIAKYVSTNKRAVFDVNQYFGKRCNKRGSELCTIPSCQECRSLEEQAKRRKLIKNTLYNSAMTMNSPCIVPNNMEFYRHLKGYNMAHPIYKNQLNF